MSKMTHFWTDFGMFRGAFISITHYLIDFSEGKKNQNEVIHVVPSALAIMTEADFLSVRSVSKVNKFVVFLCTDYDRI